MPITDFIGSNRDRWEQHGWDVHLVLHRRDLRPLPLPAIASAAVAALSEPPF